jgi:aminopeptidase N
MENWGLVTYRENALLYNPNRDTINDKKRVALVVSHELAHQWFGNLGKLDRNLLFLKNFNLFLNF